MEKSVWRRREGEGERRRQSPEEDSYFVVDPESSLQGSTGSARPGFLQQQGDILAALRQAALKNNLLIYITLDAVSLVIPGKRLYELVYNRLGNDLCCGCPSTWPSSSTCTARGWPTPSMTTPKIGRASCRERV